MTNTLPLTLPDKKKIGELFLPFVSNPMSYSDGRVRKRCRADARRYFIERLVTTFRHFYKGSQRREGYVQKEYDHFWTGQEWSDLTPDSRYKHLLRWSDQYYLGNARVVGRVVLSCLESIIQDLQPARVLEVGCGSGMNLLLLAERFPEIEFSGLDLSSSGVQCARELDAQDSLPEELVRFAPFLIDNRRKPGRIKFIQGNAIHLPFPQGYFDLVYTNQALEQMEFYRDQVLAEIHRVCFGHTAFFEPFRDWNESGTCRNRIVAKDYFAARISDLNGYGFEPIVCRNDFPVKSYMHVGLVLTRRGPEISESATDGDPNNIMDSDKQRVDSK